jgi:AraC-like DNA-binding protein
MINLQYQAPLDALTPFVSSFYHFDYQGPPMKELERADRAQFRFLLRGSGQYHFIDGTDCRTYPVTIVGPTTAPMQTSSDGPTTVFGWGMTPAGWAALMGKAAGDWVDKAFDARTVFGDALMDLQRQLSKAADVESQFAIGQAAAEKIFATSDTAPFEFTAIVDQWLLNDVEHDIDALTMATGLSLRQQERLTKHYYGMPPKKLARKYRAVRAAHMLAVGDSLNDTELGLSFYDQSHLIREIKQFTGLTPSELKAGHSILTEATMRERGKLGNSVSPLVSES